MHHTQSHVLPQICWGMWETAWSTPEQATWTRPTCGSLLPLLTRSWRWPPHLSLQSTLPPHLWGWPAKVRGCPAASDDRHLEGLHWSSLLVSLPLPGHPSSRLPFQQSNTLLTCKLSLYRPLLVSSHVWRHYTQVHSLCSWKGTGQAGCWLWPSPELPVFSNHDHTSGINILVNTGTAVSVIPPSGPPNSHQPTG